MLVIYAKVITCLFHIKTELNTTTTYSVQLPPESSFLSGATFYNSHIIKASMAPPLANEVACQNAGDALGGCIPAAASALMNVTLGRTHRRNNSVGPGGFALILAHFFTFIITDERVPDEPTGPISQLEPQTNMMEITNAKQMSASENGLIILPPD